jgi:YegS/Rv2252/BmrU family lipid kinase
MARRRRALLIINTKSGPRHDSVLRVREIVDMLATFDIRVDVRLKLSKSQARRDARAAAKSGYPLVIAAGGDGTVESVAAGLIGTDCVLGIIPLGTYNNVATCLGIPKDTPEACALIAGGSPRAIDAGQVTVRGSEQPRVFFETCAVGLGAVLTAVGQDAEKGRWKQASRALPGVVGMSPMCTQVRLDGGPPIWVDTLLVTVSNAPRGGAGLQVAPEAAMDDGLLDVCIYEGLQQVELATRLVSLKAGSITDDKRVRYARAVSVKIRSAQPLSVAADSKLIGKTPARIAIRAAAVLALVGPGAALRLPVPDEVGQRITELAPVVANRVAEAPPPPEVALATRQRNNGVLASARILAVPVATALVLKALPPIARAIQRRLDRR